MFLVVLTTIIFAVFSTTVMGYISLATPIGPWIDPTLVLFASLLFPLMRVLFRSTAGTPQIILAVGGGAIGGILATAIGFSFPTLYFLDLLLFDAWMANPGFFVFAVGGLSFAAGLLGILIADLLEERMIVGQGLAFPIGEMSYKMITAQQQVRKSYELLIGFFGSMLFSVLQQGITFCKSCVPKCMTVGLLPETLNLSRELSLGALTIPAIKFDLLPVYWAIGFITGTEIIMPLLLGAVLKFLVADTINNLWFTQISSMNFMLAFASGMVLSGALPGLVSSSKALVKTVKKWAAPSRAGVSIDWKMLKSLLRGEVAVVALVIVAFLSYFHFTLMQQIYLVLFTVVCTYQMLEIAGKIGLAQLGRFATFVMVPALFLFNLNAVQIMMIATFVEICGGVAVNALFSRKMARLGNVRSDLMRRYQLIGLVVSSVAIGVVLLLLVKRFGLGTPELFAQKAKLRALLVQSGAFDYWVLAIGFVAGLILKWLRCNPMWVLGGLLMPLNITLGLSFGAMLTKVLPKPNEWHPFWSGVFAAQSMWMVVKALI